MNLSHRTPAARRRLMLALAALALFAVSCTISSPERPLELTAAATEASILEPVKLGNVFFEDERVQVRVNVSGDRVTWVLRDVRNVVVAEGHAPMRGRGRTAGTTLDLRLPKGERGFYRLSAEVLRGGSVTASAETTLAVLSRYDFSRVAPENSIFAAQTHFGSFAEVPTYDAEQQRYVGGVAHQDPELIPLLEYAGVRTARDELPWSRVEPERRVYVFPEQYTAYMTALNRHGISSLNILNYGNRVYDQDDEGIGAIPYTDDGRDGYANYGRTLIETFPNQIVDVEIWNEPNARVRWNRGPCRNDGPPLPDPKHLDCYVALTKATFETIKAAHPNVNVTGPAGVTLPYGYLEGLFERDILDYLDAVTVHPYPPNAGAPEFSYRIAGGTGSTLEDRALQIRDLIRQHGGSEDTLVYFTELGWPTGTAINTVSELGQAKYLSRAYVLALAGGVDKFFWYDFINDGVEDDKREQNFGVIHAKGDPLGSYTPKPAYVAYAVAARQLTGATFAGKDPAPQGIFSYVFRRDGQDLRVLWLPADTDVTGASTTVTLQASGPLTVTDMVGRTKLYTPVNGQVFLTLAGDPIYVEGNVTAIAEGAAIRLEPGGADAPLVLVVDNSEGTRPLHANFRLEGEARTYPVLAQAGEVVKQPVTLSGEEGLRTVYVDVTVKGRLAGSLYLSVYIVNPEDLPFPADAYYGDAFPYPGSRGETLQGDPPQLDTTGTSVVYNGFAPAQFVVDSVSLTNNVNEGSQGVLRVSPPAGSDVTLMLPVPARQFSAEVDLVPFTGNGDGSRNVGLILSNTGTGNYFNSAVALRAGIGLLGNHSLRVQRSGAGGAQYLTPVANLNAYAPDNWNRLRLDVDLDAGSVTVFFNGAEVGSYTFSGLNQVQFIGLEAAPGAGAGHTAYLDNFSVSPLEGEE